MTVAVPFPVIDVALGQSVGVETMGTKGKFWIVDADKQRHLFKFARPATGEHWSEKLVAEIGSSLGLPVAHVELARCDQRFGTLSRSFIHARDKELRHGNQVLQAIDAAYDVDLKRRATRHTLDAIFAALAHVEPPEALEAELEARGTFVGYLMLDALVLNTDRHHENWAVIVPDTGRPRLAPSYDHGSSLGRELTDAKRRIRLTTGDRFQDLAYYVAGARTPIYRADARGEPLHPIDAFAISAVVCPTAAKFWLARLGETSQDSFRALVERVPSEWMTDPAREFALALLSKTRDTLLSYLEP